jgi:hypothetical protein
VAVLSTGALHEGAPDDGGGGGGGDAVESGRLVEELRERCGEAGLLPAADPARSAKYPECMSGGDHMTPARAALLVENNGCSGASAAAARAAQSPPCDQRPPAPPVLAPGWRRKLGLMATVLPLCAGCC